MSNTDTDLVNGFFAKEPHQNAPDFVKGKLSIKLADFAQYLRALKAAEPDVEWLNLDLKVSKGGKLYVSRDKWEPDSTKAHHDPKPDLSQPNGDVPF